MQAYLIFLSLISLCFAKATPGNQTFYNYAYALGYREQYLITHSPASNQMDIAPYSAYDPSGVGMFDANAVNNIRSAYQGHFTGQLGPNVQENINFINDIIMAANSYGIAIGIYTNAYDWDQFTKGANVGNAMLWYWGVYGAGPSGETPANFDDFRPFAGFYRPMVKQFGQKENVCGIVVNRDVYTMNTMKHQVGLRQKLDGKIVVGLLGSTIGFVQSV